MLKESRYVRLATTTMFRVLLKKARIPLFLHHKKSNHIFTSWQHIVLLVLRQYEDKSYRMFIVEWLIEAYYYLRIHIQLSHIPHYYTTLQKFAARKTGTMLGEDSRYDSILLQ
jgi:hypothetical protein